MTKDVKTRVLLVDDDPEISWAVGKLLTKADCLVSACGDGAEAVELLKSKKYDILITDIQMPRMNGLALIEWAAHHCPKMRVVVMTGFGSSSVQKVSLKRGAIMYLEKPFDIKALVDVVVNADDRGSFSGSVDSISLFDYVQLVFQTMKKVLLKIRSTDGQEGIIYISNGTSWHAECGDLKGLDAFYKCMAFEGGSFSTLPWEEPTVRTIDKRGDFLLMDAARTKDEISNTNITSVEEDNVRVSECEFSFNEIADITKSKDWSDL